MKEKTGTMPLIEQVTSHINDHELAGRARVDLGDILEACVWYVEMCKAASNKPLTRDELETALIDIEVHLLQHLTYHLDSLKNDLPAILDAIAPPDEPEL